MTGESYTRFDELVDLLGLKAAQQVVEARGGRLVHLPAHLTQGSAIARELGFDVARKLWEHYGGGPQDLLIPTGLAADARRRRAEIRRLIQRGYSRSQIAAMVRCHIRTVQRVRNPPGTDQVDLFDS